MDIDNQFFPPSLTRTRSTMAIRAWKHDNLKMGNVLYVQDGAICCLDFNRSGQYLAMSTKESSIHLIDALTGVEKKKVYSRTNGAPIVKYTHHDYGLLVGSDKGNNDIRYLSLWDNRYAKLFSGHKERVTSISMNPTEDYFVSSSDDKSVCLWSLASTCPLAKLQLPNNCERPYVAYDASGLIFGVMCYDNQNKSHSLRLFDSRSFESGPFQDVAPTLSSLESAISKTPILTASQVQRINQAAWTSFEFSPDGQRILVNTSSDLVLVLDSFSAKTDPVLIHGRKNDIGVNLGTSFSADAQSIITGNDDNELQVYDTFTGDLRGTLLGHVAPVGCVRCNPRYNVMAAGCVNLALWIEGS